MNPKDKAIELVNKYLQVYDGKVKEAKQCSLIAIDEMLDFRNRLYINEGSLAHQYLVEIKKEIEKL